MLIYDNKYKTKENKNWTKDKIELQHSHVGVRRFGGNWLKWRAENDICRLKTDP